jgi:radical SAM superfamily enzyme YgiQ (UPF0313 family)
MELPIRSDADRFVPPGQFRRNADELRTRYQNSETSTLIVSAFDARTRMLPFIMWDRQIVPAGGRAVSAALAAAGFVRQRLVNQAWTPNIRPSTAKIDGKSPEMLLISAMQIHSAPAYRMIADAHRMGEDRPLIIVGGPKAIYQPWEYFGFDEQGLAADVVCTGEEYVLLDLLLRLNECKRSGETMRTAFERARRGGLLDDIPGLLYDRCSNGVDHELVDTGVQRLVRDFDELPPPVDGYRFLERPHRGRFLDRQPLPTSEIHRYSRVASLLTTRGCKFRCGYCPIPAYNQFSFRTKSPEGLVRDIAGLRRELGIHLFFGTDDNFFNDEQIVVETFEALARAEFEKDDIGKAARFGTEATEFDVHKQLDVLPLCYRGGLRAIWFGIEDMTADLVNKGQSVTKTRELFAEMRRQRILPMAMMMHFDGQPLLTRDGSMRGLLNQVKFLYDAGAASVQVTVLGPASGTKDYDQVMQSGIILKTLGNQVVEDALWDGNHVISVGKSSKPWSLQRNLLLAYGLFYNPVNLLRSFLRKNWKWSDLFLQLWGMWGLLMTSWRLIPWMSRLRKVARNQYTVHQDVVRPRWPIVAPDFSRLEGPGGYVRQTVGAEEPAAQKQKSRRASLTKY